jgi:hypothetical protein
MMKSHSKIEISFDDIEVAFEEMEYLVWETGLSHRVCRRKDGRYRVVPFDNKKDEKDSICELNCRNTVGDRLINDKRRIRTAKGRTRVQGALSAMRRA